MEAEAKTIAARSRVEAMDWSLVLISQAIESTIQRCENGAGWIVQVSSADYDRAKEAIRLYRLENRSWGLRRDVFNAGLVFDWVSIGWVALICGLYWLNATRVDLQGPGILDTDAIAHGRWWRLFTAIWLHGDVAHLASNATFGFVLLGLAMGRYGTGVALLAAYLAGAGGNWLSWVFSTQPHLGLGASGMVMGCLGLLAIQSVSIWRRTSRAGREFLGGLLSGIMLFLLLGVTPGTDIMAHLGGFLSGLVLGSLLTPWIRHTRKPIATTVSTLCFLTLVLWPWWLALRHTTYYQQR